MGKIVWSAGTVVRNEGTRADGTSRLRRFLEHWRGKLGMPVILLEQSSTDDTVQIARELGATCHTVTPHGYSDSHWNDLVALAPEGSDDMWFWRLGGCDEFVSPECLAIAEDIIQSNPLVRVWWVARRNVIEGVPVDEAFGGGTDWQIALLRAHPAPVRYHPAMAHQYPSIRVPGRQVGNMDPSVVWVEHERTWREVVAANRERDGHGSAQAVGLQEAWMERVRQLLTAKGVRVD